MADWSKPEDYAYTDGLQLHDWAWEFLRDKNFREVSLKYWDACESGERAEISDFTDASLPFNLTEPAHPSVPAGNGATNTELGHDHQWGEPGEGEKTRRRRSRHAGGWAALPEVKTG